jgi:hypothetical protein
MRAKSGNGPRVARARFARTAALALLALLAAGLAAAWFSAGRAIGWLDGRANDARTALSSALRANHGLDFYAPLDGRVPEDVATGLPLLGAGAIRVPGVFGAARRFDGRPGENLVAPKQLWSPFARGGFTLAFWARFPESAASDERRLVWDRDDSTGFGLRLLDGRLEVSFGDASGIRVLSTPAPPPGRWVHLAFSLGPERAALHVDGNERAACAVSPPLSLRPHCIAFGTDLHFPPSFDVDEWGVWRRPLAPGEIARLAAARRPLPALLEPRDDSCLRRREAQASAFRVLMDAFGALRPSGPTPAVLNQTVPPLELRLSGADRRHFRKAHLEALASGFRTKRGERSRFVQASYGGKTERLVAWLDETIPASRLSSRPSFVLASEAGLFGDGSGLVSLFPPEQWGERRPDAARPLPLDQSSFVRLHLDGDFLGLYCLVPFETPAPPWFATGARDVSRPDRLHFAAPSPVPADGAGMSGEERETAWRKMLSLLATDPGFPLRRPEALLLAKRHAAAREALRLPDPAPGPAPHPRDPALPALHLYFGRPLDKLYRTDFACLHVPAGPDAEPEWLSGTGGHGGAKLRGNTSYVTGRRRSINLKFDAPIAVPGLDAPVRHLLLLSGYADPTRLRNALSFETFRAMAPDGPVRSVPVFWAQIYVNGAYAGVWECCPRLQDALGESFSALYKVRTSGGLWTSPRMSAEVVDRVSLGNGESTDDPDPYAALGGLARFVSESDAEAFASGVEDAFDLAELADFFLLVNFTGNEDGRVTNQYIGRRAADGRWLLLPWDYDKTFILAHAKEELLVSPLFARLFADVPGFADRVARRWRELRAGPLREDALDDWLNAHSALLAPLMPEDYRVTPPIGHNGDYPSAVSALRAEIRFRLSLLDRFCSSPASLASSVAFFAAKDASP